MRETITPRIDIKAVLSVPGDKSISHRAVMLGALAKGDSHISGFLNGADCLSTIDCFKKMGVSIELNGDNVTVRGGGLHGLKAPDEILDVGNSGTTLRLISGILAAQPFESRLTGDASIQKRPMNRVSAPLKQMGARFIGERPDGSLYAPFGIAGGQLEGICYDMPVASAQVKSSLLLAGLYAKGETTVIEPAPTRDHTEIMLNSLGADIKKVGRKITCRPVKELFARDISIPGDISSAAYFIAAGIMCKNSHIVINNVGINETRTGIIDAFNDMGANLRILNKRTVCGEPVADIEASCSLLKGITIGGDIIPRMIDEIPVFAAAACFADGRTVIKNAEELKVKESNRIKTVVSELKKLGADIHETPDGMIINGGTKLTGAAVQSHGDHRIAMSLAAAGLCADGETVIDGAECVDISFPGFFSLIRRL